MIPKIFLFASLLVCLPLSVRASTITLTSPGGGSGVDGGLSITVDAYGAFGSSASPANDGFFNPPGSFSSAGTTYESAIHLRSSGFSNYLAEGGIGAWGNQPSVSFSNTGSSFAESRFTFDGLRFDLKQEVQDRIIGGTKTGSSLIQNYLITNETSASKTFNITRYLDGDLFFEGDQTNDFGGKSGNLGSGIVLFEFDTGDNPTDPSTYIGIQSLGSENTSTETAFEISSYPNLRSKIGNGDALSNTVAPNGKGYDVNLAIQRDYILPAGETTFFTAVTNFGRGVPAQAPIENIAPQTVYKQIVGFEENIQFDWEFIDQTMRINVDIQLVGDDPGNLINVWEQGIESIWSNRYDLIDGIYIYPIVFDVNFVNENADYVVTVHSGTGRTNMINWYLDKPAGWDNSYHDEIAAHEFGHMLGLYDEYVGGVVNPNINPNVFTNSLMADLGPTQIRHYEDFLQLLASDTGRDLSMAFSPLPPPSMDAPIPDFGRGEGNPEIQQVPEPSYTSILILPSLLLLLKRVAGSKSSYSEN